MKYIPTKIMLFFGKAIIYMNGLCLEVQGIGFPPKKEGGVEN